MLDINAIKDCIPHRFPFLLVDRIIEFETGKRAVGIKNITANDFFGHQEYFGGELLFSGSLQVEAMAQVAAFVVMDYIKDKTKIPLFASVEQARFHKPAKPGDQLRIEVFLLKYKAGFSKFKATAYIDGEVASEASFGCMLGVSI